MIVTLIIVITIMAVRLAYLEWKLRDQEFEIEEWQSLAKDWYDYLTDKKYGEDFNLWKQELDE